ncbi:MAG: methionine adenosyltransferase [Candidatus Thermoplasmatota archaeon]
MKRKIIVEAIKQTPVERQRSELVERKGIGHPDSIADGLSESVSRALCRLYLERYGRILHHNTDETQIVGGQSAPRFGGGNVLEPAYILLVGRAVTEVNGERLPYRTAAVKAANEYLRKHFRHLDVETDVLIDCRIGQGSVDLRGLYETKKLLANDTSFGVGFAPLTETERLVLETERLINGKLKRKTPEAGEDVKVMASRVKDKIRLTVAAAMVDSEIPDKDHYISAIEELRSNVADNATKYTEREVNVDVNTGDNYRSGIYYLTVTGLSMENGDDGSVGRGNRCNGLITPNRPMSLEATSGKNPVTHVGKIYNILANRLAAEIADEHSGSIEEAHVRIVSQIGRPIDRPQAASVQLIMKRGVPLRSVKADVTALTDQWLENISRITEMVVKGDVCTF